MSKFGWSRRATHVLVAGALAGAAVLGVAAPAIANAATPVTAQAQYTSEEARTLVNPVVQSYEVDPAGEAWSFSAATRLMIEASDANVANERLAEVVKLVNAEFADKNIVSSTPFGMVYGLSEDAAATDVTVDIVPVAEITNQSESGEAYKIEISADGVHVYAASENAAMYALRTLECLAQTTDNALPCGTIVDWPDLEERRLFVDCGRKYISKDWFIRQIHEMSYMKLNTLDMHFSENLGFRIECETDPAIVSDEYLTKAEVLEILEEARLYGINVIPSIDSPGHVDQILRAHPEYGQIANDGETHYASGLDVTNEEAVAYMYSIYKEYIDLFKQGGATTDISIGCDEYMEFDRAPFTTMYQSVLTDWAHENLGPNYNWTDTLATYINNLAKYCRKNGLEPRVFNDGLYYGEGSSVQQKVEIDPTIGVDFWSQMSWNRSIANLRDLLNRGMEVIYNFNANYGYFVLRNDSRGASFDYDNNLEMWFNDWTPGTFQDNQNIGVLADDDPRIKGTAIAIWCDYPDVATEDEITEGIADSLRAMATRSWNVDSNEDMTLDEFMDMTEVLGHAAAWDKGEKLDDPGEILPAENVGKVTVNYVDEAGNAVADSTVSYGVIGSDYEVAAIDVYGYRLVSEDANASGTFAKEDAEVTFVYELYTDKTDLLAALDGAVAAEDAIDETYAAYGEALAAAQAVAEKGDATQREVDDALAALEGAHANVVLLDNLALFAEVTHPLPESGYVSGYDAYEQALDAARELIANAGAPTAEERATALAAIRDAKDGLTKQTSTTPTVTATDEWYAYDGGYPYANMLDGNSNTKCWFNQNQEVGKEVVFTFPEQVMMSAVSIQQPANVGADVIDGADVQVAGADGEWVTVGSMDSSELDWTFEFEERAVSMVRILITADKPNWYQISEVTFAASPMEEDTELADLIAKAEDLSLEGKGSDVLKQLASALLDAQEAYVSGATDTTAVTNALNAAIEAVESYVPPVVEKGALQNAVAEAKDLAEKDYTAESWAPFAAALADAEAVLADEGATQEQVDGALAALTTAKDNLVLDEEPTPDPDPDPDPDPGVDPDPDPEPGTDPDEPGTDEPGTDPDQPGDATDPDDQKPGDTTKPGTSGSQGGSGTQGSAGAGSGQTSGIPATGDPSALLAMAATGASAAAVLAGGVIVNRRSRK